MNTFWNIGWLTVVMVSLWRYFGFVYFDLADFKPASKLRKGWGIVLSFLVPTYAVSLSDANPKRFVLVGIAVTAILTPVIFPEMDPPEAESIQDWLYLHTVGAWFADLCGSAAIYGIAVVCSILGRFWIYGYAGIAGIFAVSRSLWIRIQEEKVPNAAAPSLLSLMLILAVVFTWIGFVFDSVNSGIHGAGLSRTHWQTDFSELYKPTLEGAIFGWLLARWPWLGWLRRRHN
jgi:hypothetical protein